MPVSQARAPARSGGGAGGRRGGLKVFVLHDVNLALRFASHALLIFGDGR
jgi:hypothetical protein